MLLISELVVLVFSSAEDVLEQTKAVVDIGIFCKLIRLPSVANLISK